MNLYHCTFEMADYRVTAQVAGLSTVDAASRFVVSPFGKRLFRHIAPRASAAGAFIGFFDGSRYVMALPLWRTAARDQFGKPRCLVSAWSLTTQAVDDLCFNASAVARRSVCVS